MIISILIMITGLVHMLIWMRPTRHKILLVKVSQCRFGVIRIERGLNKMWIIIKVRKTIVKIHIAQGLLKTHKQIKYKYILT